MINWLIDLLIHWFMDQWVRVGGLIDWTFVVTLRLMTERTFDILADQTDQRRRFSFSFAPGTLRKALSQAYCFPKKGRRNPSFLSFWFYYHLTYDMKITSDFRDLFSEHRVRPFLHPTLQPTITSSLPWHSGIVYLFLQNLFKQWCMNTITNHHHEYILFDWELRKSSI